VGLDHQVTEESGALVATWDAVEKLLRPGVLDALVAAHARLLEHLARAAWDEPVPDLLPSEQRRVRRELNATAACAPRLLHEDFFAHAADEPERVALVAADGRALSYGDLADAALRTARALRARGVRDGDLVGVCLPKGLEQIAAVLGVLAAGAAYVPVGVDQPSTRRETVRRLAGIRVAIGAAAGEFGTAEILTPDAAAEHPPAAGPRPADPESLAYVVFTSGSTGEPKGVMVGHAAAWNTIADIQARHGLSGRDQVLALSALDFDLSVFDIFGLLSLGGALVLPGEEQRREPREWRALVREHGVTLWNTVPALLDLLLTADERDAAPSALGSLRTVLVSGDWVGLDLPDRLRNRTVERCRLTALGGATEAAIWSNAFDPAEADLDDGWLSVPYGFPLAGQRYRVVDAAGRDCPDWVAGELWIGGAGVAEGYLGDGARTAEKFVSVDGERWYRTGDLGRYRPGGLLEFLGRTDHQLKIAGHRIEAGEVETALEAHPAVARAAVVAAGPRAARRLAAFVVPAADAASDQQPDMRAWLAGRLAPAAVPGTIEVLPVLPLTANGKVDRSELARRAESAGAAEAPGAASPRDGIERDLAALWSAALSTPAPVSDRNANFFSLGGDSLAAIRLADAIERELGVRVPVRRLLAAPTLAASADELAALAAAADHRTESGEL
jgi:yersiniabactin nonribosomal peptide synthetase